MNKKGKIITKEYLESHPNEIFVFGDNTLRIGKGGAAILRDEPNTYGFITKKYPTYADDAFYRPNEYIGIYAIEMSKLKLEIMKNPDKSYLISPLGSGLANRYRIFEEVIDPLLKNDLKNYKNVEFLW